LANHKSAKKRARQNIVRRMRNKMYLSQVKTAFRAFRSGVQSGVIGEDLQKLFCSAQSYLQKAASKGIIHRNSAARRVSRLNNMMSSKAS